LTATATCDGFFRKIVHVAVAVNDHVNVHDHEKSYFRTGTSLVDASAAKLEAPGGR
jgi:hypothetical protein